MFMQSSGNDIFTEELDVILNPVNCVGVSGAGLALAFKRKFPLGQQSYEEACRGGILEPGVLHQAYENGKTVIYRISDLKAHVF